MPTDICDRFKVFTSALYIYGLDWSMFCRLSAASDKFKVDKSGLKSRGIISTLTFQLLISSGFVAFRRITLRTTDLKAELYHACYAYAPTSVDLLKHRNPVRAYNT